MKRHIELRSDLLQWRECASVESEAERLYMWRKRNKRELVGATLSDGWRLSGAFVSGPPRVQNSNRPFRKRIVSTGFPPM